MWKYLRRLYEKIDMDTEKLNIGANIKISWAFIWIAGFVATGVLTWFFWSIEMDTLFFLTPSILSTIKGLYFFYGKYPTIRGTVITDKKDRLGWGWFYILVVPSVILIMNWLRGL